MASKQISSDLGAGKLRNGLNKSKKLQSKSDKRFKKTQAKFKKAATKASNQGKTSAKWRRPFIEPLAALFRLARIIPILAAAIILASMG